MLARLADRIILQPSTHPIPTEGKKRRLVQFGKGQFEVWIERSGNLDQAMADLFILKFPGTGGRAERATVHPAECWQDLSTEVWAVNPPGYGGSDGRASIQHLAEVAEAAIRQISRDAEGRPLIVTGNSLGAVVALYVAARHDVDGLLLRNPPPLRELIISKHGWWNLGLSRVIADQVPSQLCSLRNGARASVAAVFIMSGKDRTVPPRYQRLITDNYAGQNQIMLLPNADHASPMDKASQQQYRDLLAWLRQEAMDSRCSGCENDR